MIAKLAACVIVAIVSALVGLLDEMDSYLDWED